MSSAQEQVKTKTVRAKFISIDSSVGRITALCGSCGSSINFPVQEGQIPNSVVCTSCGITNIYRVKNVVSGL